ncbi:MAG: DUF3857 domain-containing protein [Kiritimatiellia bacterium]
MKRLLLFSAALLLSSSLFAAGLPAPFDVLGDLLDRDAVAASAAEVTVERYPDADDVLVDDLVRERYLPDGTALMLDDEYYKVLTEKGRREHLTRHFGFNVVYGTAIVARAEILKPDGRCIPVDLDRNCTLVTDARGMGSNIYDPNDKTLALSVPGLEVGDTCHILCLRATTKARVPDAWADYMIFESTAPVKAFTYEIIAPADRPLRHVVLRDPVEGTVESSTESLPDGPTLHRWRFRDVPQAFPEPNMPPLHTQVMRILSSTSEDWPALSRWYWNLCLPRLESVTDEMRETVAALVEGASSDAEKVRRIFAWVSQNVRYMGITTEEVAPGYEPHDVSTTFHNRYGVCRDKAALLVAMLRLADLEAFPVLIHAGAKMDPEVPLPYFNHAIAAVALPDGGYQLMDPTDENTRDLLPAYLCNRSYLVAHPNGETLAVSPVPPAEDNLVRVATTGDLAPDDTLSLETRFDFEGVNDSVYRNFFSRIKPEQRRTFFEGLVKHRLPGAEVLRFELLPDDLRDTEQPLSATLACRVRDWPLRGEGLDAVELPLFSGSVGYVNWILGDTGLRKRRFPLETEVACGTEETIGIVLHGALGAPRTLPDPLDIDADGIRLHRSVAIEDDTLRVSRTLLVRQPELSPDEYVRLREILAESERVARQRPLFEAHPPVLPDLRVLSDETSVTLLSPTSWSIERRTAREVLTYAGVKDASEFKVAFNPAWTDFELVSAWVENPDGSVRTVRPEELNLMDAPWAANAPRYPAGRIFVASLPGVQTGSVLRISTRALHRDRPFFHLSAVFQGTEPIDRKEVAIRIPRDMPDPLIRHPGKPVTFVRTPLADGGVELRWRVENSPPVPPEDSRPPSWTYLPSLSVSFGDWAEYAGLIHDAFERSARGGSRKAEALARELVEPLDSPVDKVRAIRDHVVRNVRLAGPNFTDLPLDFSEPDTTLADGYGHSADRALLLATMLRAAGFDARPQLASPGADTSWADEHERFPAPDAYNVALVAVRAKRGFLGLTARPALARGVAPDDPIYLNDTDQYAELGACGLEHSRLLSRDGSRAPLLLPEEIRSRETSSYGLEVDGDGTAFIAVTNEFFGAACAGFRRTYREMPPEERDRHHQSLLGGLSHAALPAGPLELDLDGYPGRLVYTAMASNYAARAGSTLTLLVPGAGGKVANLRADTRKLPLLCGGRIDAAWDCTVTLPAGTTAVAARPPELAWTLPCGLGELRVSSEESRHADGRLVLRFRSDFRRVPAILPPEEYPVLLEMNRRLDHPRNRTLILELR